MDLVEATILVAGHQKWIDTVTGRYGARLRLLNSKGTRRRDEVLELFEITVDRKLEDRLLRYLRNSPDIAELEITNSSHGRLVGIARAKGVVMRCVADSDCFLVYASNGSSKEITWRVLGTNHSVKELLSRLKRLKVDFKVSDISEVKRKRALTTRQEWLIRSAYEGGYFDYPKRIRIGPLARMLEVAPPTLYESLRKTQKKLLEEHFREGPPLGR
ncbi:MAG: helix-turn-helix domain-containing protein [Nitrososphaerota archaeon]|nr:helix-turn-helix domain-containing protein [Nitrososphaerota archaeon]